MYIIKLAWIGLFIFLGCWRSNQVENSVTGAISAWKNAVLHNRPRQAYALLDHATQQKMPYARFEMEWKTNRVEMLYHARQLKPENARLTAVIHLKNNDSATLVSWRRGIWKVDDAPGLRPVTSSPEALLRGIIDALKRHDWPLYLALLTPAYRNAVEEDIDQKIKMFEKAAENLTDVSTGDTLRVMLDTAGVVLVLRKINGSWRIDGFETMRGGKPK